VNTYIWLKFIHVVSTAGWIGGFAAIAVLNILASRNPDPRTIAAFLANAKGLGARLVGPASGLAILTGIAAMLLRHLPAQRWIVWGIVAVALFIVIGVAALRPVLKRLTAATQGGSSSEEVRVLLRRQRFLLTLNLLVLLSAFWAMIFKPE